MTEDEINNEMAALVDAIRTQQAKKKKSQSDFNDIRSMEAKHALLAKNLQKIQRAELATARKENK